MLTHDDVSALSVLMKSMREQGAVRVKAGEVEVVLGPAVVVREVPVEVQPGEAAQEKTHVVPAASDDTAGLDPQDPLFDAVRGGSP